MVVVSLRAFANEADSKFTQAQLFDQARESIEKSQKLREELGNSKSNFREIASEKSAWYKEMEEMIEEGSEDEKRYR